jgi:hypothetical protein
MSNKTDDNLFMVSSLTRKYAAEFYQDVLKGIGSYEQLGKRLIHLGEQAHAFRQFDKVQEVGQLLSNIPIKDYQAIGYYFLAVAANNKGNGDQEKARQLYEQAAEAGSAHYQAKSLLSLAAVAANTNNRDLEMYYYLETIKARKMSVAALEALRGIAIYKAMEGYHDKAVKDLEAILPIIKFAPPHIYYAYLNSFAVELGEVGRRSEARNISRIVLASPFAHAYSEWQETGRELDIIDCKESRSYVSLKIKPEPEVKTEPKTEKIKKAKPKQETETASVIAFPALKEVSQPGKPERVKAQELSDMTSVEKRELILAAVRSGAVLDSEYDKMMFMLGLVRSGPAEQVIDLEDETVLTELIIDWAHLIEPEELAAVMSALRDCTDDWRRTNIMDSIIRKAFEYSRTCNITEAEWRLKVECRLPKK